MISSWLTSIQWFGRKFFCETTNYRIYCVFSSSKLAETKQNYYSTNSGVLKSTNSNVFNNELWFTISISTFFFFCFWNHFLKKLIRIHVVCMYVNTICTKNWSFSSLKSRSPKVKSFIKRSSFTTIMNIHVSID